jgi:hypothetical protein
MIQLDRLYKEYYKVEAVLRAQPEDPQARTDLMRLEDEMEETVILAAWQAAHISPEVFFVLVDAVQHHQDTTSLEEVLRKKRAFE